MRRILASLAPWMAVAATAQAAATLTVDYTYRGTFVDQGARWQGACYVTPALMRRVGWQVDVDNGVATVAAEGRTFQLESNIVDGKRLYCFDEALRFLGGSITWDDEAQTARVLGRVRSIEKTPKGIRIDSTLSCRPRAFRQSNPPRLVVDLAGTVLDTDKVGALPAGWSATQNTPDTVRVVLENPGVANAPVPTLEESRTVGFDIVVPAAKPLPPGQVIATVSLPGARRARSAGPRSWSPSHNAA